MKKIVSNITYTIFVLLVLGLVFLLMAPPIPGVGNFEVKIVKSGSMEPTIMTGAVVAIHETNNYKVGDVITFAEKGANIPTTHRIIGVEKVEGKNYFVTKGDANEDRDANSVSPKDIIGKVILDIPYVGFILDFARQPLGFGLLVGIPALIIVLDELTNIWLEVRRIRGMRFDKDMIAPLVVAPYDPSRIEGEDGPANDFYKNHLPATTPTTKRMDIRAVEKKKETETQSRFVTGNFRSYHDIRPKMDTVVAGFVMVIFFGTQMGVTLAYPSDVETSFGNSIHATAVDFSVSSNKTDFSVEGDQITDDASALINLTLHDLVSEDLVYYVEVENGASALCDLIILEAEAPFSYNDNLLNLSKTNLSLSENFSLNFSLSNSYDSFDSCIFDLVFTAHLADNPEKSVYFDVETITFEFSPVSLIVPSINSVTSEVSGLDSSSSNPPTSDDVPSEEVQVEKESTESELVSEEVVETNETVKEEEQVGDNDKIEKEVESNDIENQEQKDEDNEQEGDEEELVSNDEVELIKEVETEKGPEEVVENKEEQQN